MAEYIRRDAAIAEAEYDGNFVLVVPVKKIRNLPAADVIAVRHGRWGIDEFGHYCRAWRE